ncbi:MAG: 50S ribosomal protein L23 [Bdellovibrionales bacterium]|nr:50S ribosomal protein L23 [Bdellovibrionales bacterium]
MSYIIKKPLVTEKNNFQAEKGIYVFLVSKSSNKTVIKEHVERYFGVKVASIKTAIYRKRSRRVKRQAGKVKYFKKAFVRLKPGEQITTFEGQ